MRNAIFTLLVCLGFFDLSAQCPQLTWSDEFDGTSLNLSKWEPQIGDGCAEGICGWGNSELQYYKAQNAVVSNGTLKIIAKKERVRGSQYTSARLRTKGLANFNFGRFEARIKLPAGQGLWPAFWMLSTNEPYGQWPQSGEIDIMEFIGQHPKTVHGTIHYGDIYPNNQFQGTGFDLYDGSTFADDFHVFAVEWEPGILRWYVDDILYQTKTIADVAPSNWPFDASNQMHFLLNLAVGGNWPGNPDATTPFPSQMEVDYVRVYENGFNPSIAGDRLVANQATGEVYTINNAPSGSNFSWSVPSGASIVSGAGTSAITVNWGTTSGNVTCLVTTGCGSKTYSINVVVEQPFVKNFSFENFDDPANVTLNSATGSLTEVSNPNTTGINSSLLSGRYVRNAQELYDVISYSTASITDASAYESRNKKFYMDVLTQAPIGTNIIIQLENSSTASATNYPSGRHSRYVGTITTNGEWQRIEFDFLDAPDGSTPDGSVNQIIILFASNSFTSDTYYFDNFDSYNIDDGTGGSNNPPTASFTFSTNNLAADFNGSSSSDSDGTISSWNWNFGDGNTGSGAQASHTYAAGGSYTVVLTVTDNEGATAIDEQVVSVSSGPTEDPVSLHVQSIVTGTAGAGQGSKRGTAIVTIHNDQESAVPNATVTGTFSGTFSQTVSGVTAADGTVTFTTSATAKGGVTVNFCVDNVAHTSLTYNAVQNDITCTGAAGSSLKNSAQIRNGEEYHQPDIFPNPSTGFISINQSVDRLQIIDLTGRNIMDIQSPELIIDISTLPKGTYVVKLEVQNELHTQLLIKM